MTIYLKAFIFGTFPGRLLGPCPKVVLEVKILGILFSSFDLYLNNSGEFNNVSICGHLFMMVPILIMCKAWHQAHEITHIAEVPWLHFLCEFLT